MPSRPPIRAVFRGTDWTKTVSKQLPVVTASPRIEALLAKPSWSVKSLLPRASPDTTSEVTREKLHHLLRLSALQPPPTEAKETAMLETLRSQLHFVKEIQKVDTTGVEPLQAIRDETEEGIEEQTVRLADLQIYLDREQKVGKNGTIRRRRDVDDTDDEETKFDPFNLGVDAESRKVGRYFVVRKHHKDPSSDPVD